METCDVLVIGGGPAGSTCAWKLRKGGLDVLVMDRAPFPREKPCAGWITPEVLAALEIDREEYGEVRTLQAINSFRTGIIRGAETVTRYGKTVSYGIRRSEFDHFLLERSGVRKVLGEPVVSLDRRDRGWIVNGRISARILVGAGGHFCPAARILGAEIGREDAVLAQATEFPMGPGQERLCPISAEQPSIFFCRDMKGYGWLFRKGRFLNAGLGRMDRRHLGRHTRDFCAFLQQRGYLPPGAGLTFRGHAYLLFTRRGGRRRVADGVLLIGDAAGLAYPQSGEGILPAIESALMASETILAAGGDYRSDNLNAYDAALDARFGGSQLPSSAIASAFSRRIGAGLISSRWFARHVVLDRWFLHKR